MLARVFALLPLALLPLALLVVADQQCVTKSPNCCNLTASGSAKDPAIASQLKSFGLGAVLGDLVADVSAVVFTQCTGVVGTGSDCSQTPVCCEKNLAGGLVGVTCSPVDVL